MARKMMALSSPLMEITLDGGEMTIKTTVMSRTMEDKFKFGAEYEEPMPNMTLISVTKIVNDNELLTESVIKGKGVKSSRHLFTDDDCIVTLTHEKTVIVGKRYFKRI